MKNKIILIAIAIIVLAAAEFVVCKQSNAMPQNPPAGRHTNFNFIFRYGVGAKNELNTFEQTYTKDMIMDPPITIKFKLSNSELMGIYKKINDLKLLEKNEKPTKNMLAMPCSSYYLKVQIDSAKKELSWDNCRGKISDRFQQFTNYIIQIIESKEEYKELPIPKGGYL